MSITETQHKDAYNQAVNPSTGGNQAQPEARYTGIVVNHTHWDREWYMPFQRYRVLLIDAVDHLLEILGERPDYTAFTLDGQTVVLEDYLEVRPEKRPELARHIESGRIEVGPWYVLPDEFIPSGESLIRNLLLGRKQMRDFDATLTRVGYLPDTFGHPAQLPQIMAGFDLDSMIIFRGVQSNTSEFTWEAPDGTGLLTIYLPGGYYNAMELARSPGYWLKEKLQTSLDFLTRFATTDAVLLMNGCDHFEPQPATQEFLDQANRVQNQVYLRQGTLTDYVELVRKGAGELPVRRAEWRYNRPARITPGVLSARMYLKQADFQSSTLLERGAEPLQGLAWALGYRHDSGLLATAWRYLLQNHPHDSICGCSIDEVHRDGETRYRWVRQIGSDLVERAANYLTRPENGARSPEITPAVSSTAPGFMLFNTLAAPRTEIVRQQLHFLTPGLRFEIFDVDGQKVPFQELRREKMKVEWDPQRRQYFCEGHSRPALVVSAPDPDFGGQRWQRWQGEEVELLFRAEIPAGGYTTLRVVPISTGEAADLSQKESSQLETSDRTLENELVRVEVAANGSFSLLDKTSGRLYGPLNVFRSEADRGDEYSFCPVPSDPVFTSQDAQAEVRLVEQGALRSTLEIKYKLAVPARLSAGRTHRVSETVEIPISTRLSLSPGRRCVEIATEIENTACDHRLRAYFASGVQAETVHAQGQFMVMPRQADLSAEERARVPEFDEEQEVNYHPQRAFVDVSDEKDGLAVLNRGLPEYEAEVSPEGVWLGLTLLRCVGWLSRDDLSTRYKHAGPALETPEAQCLGTHHFEYAVVPHQGDWLEGGVAQEAEAYVTPVHSAAFASSGFALAPQQSIYRLDPSELLFSACKRSDDGKKLLLRAYNTASFPLEATLRIGLVGSVRQANLAERDISDILTPDPDGAYHIGVRPHEIITFSIQAENTGDKSSFSPAFLKQVTPFRSE